MNIVLRVYLLRDVWARVVASTTAFPSGGGDNVAAKGELANALGEGSPVGWMSSDFSGVMASGSGPESMPAAPRARWPSVFYDGTSSRRHPVQLVFNDRLK